LPEVREALADAFDVVETLMWLKKELSTSRHPHPHQTSHQIAMGSAESIFKEGPISDVWNGSQQSGDSARLYKLLQTHFQGQIGNVVGQKVLCSGSSGFGSYTTYVVAIDTDKGWVQVNGGDCSENTWKTPRTISSVGGHSI